MTHNKVKTHSVALLLLGHYLTWAKSFRHFTVMHRYGAQLVYLDLLLAVCYREKCSCLTKS